MAELNITAQDGGADAAASKKKFDFKKELRSWLLTIVTAVIAVFLINTFVARVVLVEGRSMEPTLHDNERIITTSLVKEYNHGDIVVIRRDDEPAIVKRVIGVAGDSIDIDFENGIVYRNGQPIDEPYINEPTHNKLDFTGEVVVPENCIFVLGDNRNHSDDSRDDDIGMVNIERVFGKAVFRIYPFSKAGKM